jgi:uncharacterized membrane protein
VATAPPGKTNIGLDQHLAGALAYLLGIVSGVVLLLIEPENRFVRFHAFQSIFTFVSIAVAATILVSVPVIGRLMWAPCFLGATILWAYLMYKALMGERYKLPFIGDWAENQLK